MVWRATRTRGALSALAAALTLAASAEAGPRDVQIREIKTAAQVVTLHNYGNATESLANFRFCTADENEQLQYTFAFGAISLDPGEELNIHWANDAPPKGNAVNVSSFGGAVADPIDNGPFGLALYFNLPFANPANMADYVQWSDSNSNPGNASADARADEAVSAGLWTAVDAFVITTPDTTRITLRDGSGGQLLHGPDDYEIGGDTEPCPADFDGNGEVGFDDFTQLLASWGPCPGCPADLNGDGDVGFDDFTQLLASWGPCP